MMLRKANICSVHPLPFLKPACSCVSCWSTALDYVGWWSIFTIILLGTDKRVIPRQLLHFLRFPFLGIFTIIPSDEFSGIFFSSHIAVKSGGSSLAASSVSAFNNSALRSSCPGAFPFWRNLASAKIYSFIGGSMLMSRSASAVS